MRHQTGRSVVNEHHLHMGDVHVSTAPHLRVRERALVRALRSLTGRADPTGWRPTPGGFLLEGRGSGGVATLTTRPLKVAAGTTPEEAYLSWVERMPRNIPVVRSLIVHVRDTPHVGRAPDRLALDVDAGTGEAGSWSHCMIDLADALRVDPSRDRYVTVEVAVAMPEGKRRAWDMVLQDMVISVLWPAASPDLGLPTRTLIPGLARAARTWPKGAEPPAPVHAGIAMEEAAARR